MARALVAACALSACSFTANQSVSDGGSDDSHPVDAARLDAPKSPDVPPAPMVSLVQTGSAGGNPWNGNAKTIAMTLAQPSAAGDLIAVYVSYAGATSLSSVTDNVGDEYTIVQTVSDSGDGQKSSTAYAMNVATGATTITATFGSSQCCRLIVAHELRGADPAAPLDGYSGQHQGSTGTSPDSVTTGPMTTTAAADYIFAVSSNSSNDDGQTITAGTNATERVELTPSGGNPTCSEDSTQPSPGAISSTFTYAADGSALTQQMAFKPKS